jgi:hypothetical protein
VGVAVAGAATVGVAVAAPGSLGGAATSAKPMAMLRMTRMLIAYAKTCVVFLRGLRFA